MSEYPGDTPVVSFLSEGDAQSFIIGDFSHIHVGAPFNIPLLIKDGFGNPTRPPPDLKPLVECRCVKPRP